ncbi:MAG: hypothetical protein KDC05_12810, partial [Bacteroidales bacterium]|nr:hypothetical protein [Bacteroidales bacterium]
FAQNTETDTLLSKSTFKDLSFRSIGPAFMSGRIADVAIDPTNENTWYVAVGSGGVWKTTNAGTTWTSVFDDQVSYSIGCITIDPSNPHTIWVGTGENVGGRHVGYGDGIYRSEDNGRTWKNMGLKESQHISKIILHPENPDIIWVAAQGPLWNKGDQRGLYKTTDGGKSWIKTLGDDEWTGVTDIVIDSRNPDLLYAATWQRHRNVAAYMGGGPGSGIHRSTDGGDTWQKLETGLPKSNMGKIGLAISPQNPDVVYAAIELDRRTGAVYRSENRGGSWQKMSDAVSGATGPHYYQELYASPHQFDKIFLVDVRMQVSEDGGKHFKRMNEKFKHSDNHSIAFKKDDPNYMLVGTDGGLYETFDDTETWRFVNNLPLTQFYKIAVDDAKPFYNIFGGTQDNTSQGGPSQTIYRSGIRNSNWSSILGGDGHQTATEPGNPDIVYAQSQEGELHRIDMTTGEAVYIKPQPAPGEPYERNNWDSPILVSPHNPARLYFASQRVWRSDNRGDSWTAISEDLTKNLERLKLPIMDKTWGWDATWDFEAMSNYNSITSLSESPLQEGLIYAGTDDGLIRVTEDGGDNWEKIEVGNIEGVPATAFVNDIKADLFDVNTVYVVLDNHKFGDLEPYLLKSSDKGNTWQSIRGDLPERTLLWRVVQDYQKPELLFLGTEFGVYFTIDGGKKWIELTGGMPNISIRDLVIQKEEDDLVAASFGRGIFILDDYSPLREVTPELLDKNNHLFAPDTALLYTPRRTVGHGEKGTQGTGYFTAPNPPFGAIFTYYLKEGLKTKKEIREENEKKLAKENKDIPFPEWEKLEAERNEVKPTVILAIEDAEGNPVNRISAPIGAGIHRVNWELRYPSARAIDPERVDPESDDPTGLMVAPGSYRVSLLQIVDGKTTVLAGPQSFEVVPLFEGALEGNSFAQTDLYRKEVRELQRSTSALSKALENTDKRVEAMHEALTRTIARPGEPEKLIYKLRLELDSLDYQLNGNRSRRMIGEKINPTLNDYYRVAYSGADNGIYGPTAMHRQCLMYAQNELENLKSKLEVIRKEKIPAVEKLLEKAGAPWIEGQKLPE